MPDRCARVLRRTADAEARGQKCQSRKHGDDRADAAPTRIYPLHVSHLLPHRLQRASGGSHTHGSRAAKPRLIEDD